MTMSEEYENVRDYSDYMPALRLGRGSVTWPCVLAMATILTSALRPEKITAVFGATRGYEHESVLFLVWDWLPMEVVIIPDGFGTHGGEGGSGLSKVIGLIKFYNVPLQQVWMYDEEAFRELANGNLTEEVFDEAQEAPEYNWDFYPVRKVREVKKGKQRFLEVLRTNGLVDWSIPLP
jgi:hypothetical protein